MAERTAVRGQGDAFTLIELLLIVAVILVMVMVLMPRLASAKRKAQQVQLLDAAERGDLAEVKSLIEQGVSINCRSEMKFGWTPLHAAILHLQTNVIYYLVGKGADVNAADQSGETPLMRLAVYGDEAVPIARLLVEHGANVAAKDRMGATVWSFANSDPPKPRLIQVIEAAQRKKSEAPKP